MSELDVVLGIDTSNYTTSVALMGQDGEIIANLKRPLAVKEGERGLRQSDAVFSHVKNLPDIMNEVKELLVGKRLAAVGVSDKPRNIEGSYMPCFLTGVAAAESICATSGVPLFRFSHQCGHLMAAAVSSGMDDKGDYFAAFHVSGGTTDMLRAVRTEKGFVCDRVGGSADINAGQLIDRIGVAMGMPFPAGVHIEEAALSYSGKIPKKRVSIDGCFVNLSGIENYALKLYHDTEDKAIVSAFVLDHVSRVLCALAQSYVTKFGPTRFLFAGGVMSNTVIKSNLKSLGEVYFAEPLLSADNAVGIAALARDSYLSYR